MSEPIHTKVNENSTTAPAVADLVRNKKPMLIGMIAGFIFLSLGVVLQCLNDSSILASPPALYNTFTSLGSCIFASLLVERITNHYLITPQPVNAANNQPQ